MKLLVVDDHRIGRGGRAACFRQTGPGKEVLQAGDADEMAVVSQLVV